MEWALIADVGRVKGLGLARPRPGLVTLGGSEVRVRDDGCWRTLNT
jgi:hypothetical protein